ncbi:MAG: flagellar hook-associated protein FlgK [Rhodobacteraceae bacterium]|nr:flagellar hook-associated protein FlgK [Paracoccaceae bacterium]
MSLTAAIHGAMSGLKAASRGTQIVSENISNATNPDYARRSLALGASAIAGPGVRVLGVNRHADPVLLAGKRDADAEFAAAKIASDFWTEAQRLVGAPEEEGTLAAQLNQFESALIATASMPDSASRLDILAQTASDLASGLVTASEGVQDLRTRADRDIALQVDQLNTALQDVAKLNKRIRYTAANGGSIAGLQDQRQARVDAINEIVPINVIDRGDGVIALYSDGGAILLDGSAVEIGFTPVNLVTPYMTQSNGLLGGLTLNGSPIASGPDRHALPGGSLAALFDLRDRLGVQMQDDLDIVARDLVERFQDTGLDPTLAATDPGLFTDAGARFDPVDALGLSYRLSLNTLVDPSGTAETWRLRDGLGAAAPGSVGDASLLQAYSDALLDQRAPSQTSFGTALEDSAGMMETLLSRVSSSLNSATAQRSFATAAQSEMTRIVYEQGVDTDAELQTLLVLEKAYAANAKIIETADELLDALLRI